MQQTKWKKILVPNGRDYEYCVKAFERKTGIVVPSFPDRTLSVDNGGRRFIRVKSRDMPELLQEGFGDIGMAYTDICEEKAAPDTSSLSFDVIDSAHLQFCLLLPEAKSEELLERIHDQSLAPVTVATIYPAFLKNCLERRANEGVVFNISITQFTPSGSVEAMPALGLSDAVADVVNTGISAYANRLMAVHLEDIYPALLYKK